MSEPDVSVVIPCRDVVDVVEDQLRALQAQDFPGRFEVVLSDNGSRDGLADHVEAWAREFGLDLRRVDSSAVGGVSHARNVGLRAARAPVVAICDADDLVVPGWLRALAEAARGAELVGGVMDVISLNDEVRRAWRPGPPADGLPQKFGFLPYAMGCNLAVHRDVALGLGGWDETYVAGGDDVDFAWRLQLAGHRLAVATDAVVQYRYRTDLPGTARQFRAYARCEDRLLRQFAPAGARPEKPSRFRRDLSWLVRNVRDVRGDEAARGRWVCRFATFRGRTAGNLRGALGR
ncbi:glycosyltransferase [Kineococcus gynurae]|uniref:Glycosyltransferase n=1 Tax=Kineococcus gynurae TaxID=452979 RepID=A0ABV5LWP6_9ACTN